MEIITRADARERGLARFFTGRPCKHGHVDERYVSTLGCVSCLRGRDKDRVYSAEERELRRKAVAKYRSENKDKVRTSKAKYAAQNAERVAVKKRQHRLANLDRYKQLDRERRDRKKDELSRWHVEHRRKLRASDPVYMMKHRIRSIISSSLHGGGYGKSTKTAAILGCSWSEFVTHIERQFLPGMTWSNRSKWHIDHIVPLATATTEADVLALNYFTNLRPLWKLDNIKKGAKQTHLL